MFWKIQEKKYYFSVLFHTLSTLNKKKFEFCSENKKYFTLLYISSELPDKILPEEFRLNKRKKCEEFTLAFI